MGPWPCKRLGPAGPAGRGEAETLMDLNTLYHRTVEAWAERVNAVGPDRWDAPTPCADWTVRDLVNHLVGGNLLFAGVLGGEPTPSLEELGRGQGVDRLGDDPVAAFRVAADTLLAAFRQPGALEQVVT